MLAIREESSNKIKRDLGSSLMYGNTAAINRNPRPPKIIFVFMYGLIGTQHHAEIKHLMEFPYYIAKYHKYIGLKVSTEQIRTSILGKVIMVTRMEVDYNSSNWPFVRKFQEIK